MSADTSTDTAPALKVVHVAASIAPRDGGPPTNIAAVGRALRDLGASVTIVTTDADGPTEHLLGSGRDFSDLSVVMTRVHAPRRLHASLGMAAALRRVVADSDVVHLHGTYAWSTWVGARAARRAGKPYVLQPHGVLEPYQRQTGVLVKKVFDRLVGTRILRDAARLIFATESELRGAADLTAPGQGWVITLGGSLAPVPRGHHAAWETPDLEGRPLVVFLGRIAAKKRIDRLLVAWPAVQAAHPEARLVIAGNGDDHLLEQLQEQAGPGVVFLGPVTGVDKAALLARAAMFVLPSDNENFAIAVAEAMAAGTPVVISRHVALESLVEETASGLVVEDDTPALIAAICGLLGDPARAAELGANGAVTAREQLSWGSTARETLATYADVIRSAGG